MNNEDLLSPENIENIKIAGSTLTDACFGLSSKSGWWTDIKTGNPIELTPQIISEKLLLVVTEIAEATEGFRKNLMDDHLPTRKMAEVELGDAVIRIFDLVGKCGFDLGSAIAEKLQYNQQRADHKIENRLKDGGKKF